MSAIPVIDVGGLTSSRPEDRQRVGDELGDACASIGFLSVVEHGIDQSLIDAAFAETRRLFAQPTEVKMAKAWSEDHANRGYDPPGQQQLDATTRPDLKEAWAFGPEHLAGRSGPMQAANVWPDLDGFREPIEDYHRAAMELCARLLDGMALSLGLESGFFAPFHTAPVCTLRLLHYPPRPDDTDSLQLGAGAHTDWGALTVLAQDDLGSLQVLDKADRWIDVPPQPGALVINVGDLLALWTNDRYVSTKHRVIGVPGRDRYSLACFFDLDHEAVIECLPTCHSADNPPRYAPTTAGEHLWSRYRASLETT